MRLNENAPRPGLARLKGEARFDEVQWKTNYNIQSRLQGEFAVHHSAELSPPLPWEPAPPSPRDFQSARYRRSRIERTKQKGCRDRLSRSPIHAREWTAALFTAAEHARQVCERCPPDLESELADGGYPLKRMAADWIEVIEVGTSRLLQAVNARATAETN